ncbi:Domain of unknown function DUF1848 [Desulfofarcimen acetoxidans DSM 771]|uniref:DUF1848 domain-containing protein n=2 Tax=Desulfofarcimen acetoxidans TaxID=58138 RepID=C8VVB3_DESAS|nr:Domain of unknown function DUF1848 [Desulfofarcimen acetoxidans DSM 771]
MILSASRRTDIPCFYSDWFMNRIRAGYVLTRNPMNHAQLSRIPLSPEIVDCIVFWTKDAKNIMPHLGVLDGMGYKYCFQFTLTPYNRSLERNLRGKAEIEDTFIALSKQIGKKQIIWRYDPIILNSTLDIAYHRAQFERMCDKLADYTETLIISFVDIYTKLKTNLIREITPDEIIKLSKFIGKTAKAYGLSVVACCEKDSLIQYGIEKASCIDKIMLEKVCGCKLNILPDKNQRPGCGCMESVDIGAYNTCLNGCVYCYANGNPAVIERRYNSHNPQNELIIGTVADKEKIMERKVKSHR